MKEIVVESRGERKVAATCSVAGGAMKTAEGTDAGSAILKLFAICPDLFPSGFEYHVFGKERIISIVGRPDRYEIVRDGWGDAAMSLIIRFGADMGIRVHHKRPAAKTA